jgi:cyclopropane-fatty-acyl-phospholipid synthase
MIARLAPRPRPAAAAAVLRRVFGHVRAPFAFRLWDGTEVRLGQGEPVCTVVVHRTETFAALMDDPSPGHFAEAYVSGAIDIEGDLFAAMGVANEVEGLRLSLGERLRILATLVRG